MLSSWFLSYARFFTCTMWSLAYHLLLLFAHTHVYSQRQRAENGMTSGDQTKAWMSVCTIISLFHLFFVKHTYICTSLHLLQLWLSYLEGSTCRKIKDSHRKNIYYVMWYGYVQISPSFGRLWSPPETVGISKELFTKLCSTSLSDYLWTNPFVNRSSEEVL